MPLSREQDLVGLQPRHHAEAVALFRSEIVGALVRRDLSRGELRAALRALAGQRFRAPGAAITHAYSVPTLERWYYAYRRGGIAALQPRLRKDRGRARALTSEQRALLCDIRQERPSVSVALLLRTLVADGRLAAGAVSESTVRRLFLERGLDRVALRDGATAHTRLRWQAERPNVLWHGDVCHGPALVIDGVSRPLRIHALLDDASRYIVALEAHHAEREIEMLGLLVRALRRHGAPSALYLDNGATYRGDALRLACERLGVTLLHARPYDAPARGKMERFWRTLREACLDHLGAFTSLHDVNVRLWAFLDQQYHLAPHGGLLGRAPGVVFAEATTDPDPDPADPRHLSEAHLRDALTVRERRRVRRDTTVAVAGQDWELDQGFLAGRVVTVARSLFDLDHPPWVEHDGKRFVLHVVDPVRNARRKRPARRPAPTRADSPTPSRPAFDPPGALLDKLTGRKPLAKKESR